MGDLPVTAEKQSRMSGSFALVLGVAWSSAYLCQASWATTRESMTSRHFGAAL